VTSTWTIETQYEYMDEEHSDECMDDTLVYMSTANAIRANNMSATNMCAARNIVTSGDKEQYEYMDEEHSDEYMDDTHNQTK
jgi:hypothetical protein